MYRVLALETTSNGLSFRDISKRALHFMTPDIVELPISSCWLCTYLCINGLLLLKLSVISQTVEAGRWQQNHQRRLVLSSIQFQFLHGRVYVRPPGVYRWCLLLSNLVTFHPLDSALFDLKRAGRACHTIKPDFWNRSTSYASHSIGGLVSQLSGVWRRGRCGRMSNAFSASKIMTRRSWPRSLHSCTAAVTVEVQLSR